MSDYKTKVYYTIDGIPQYNEFNGRIPEVESDLIENPNYDGHTDLWIKLYFEKDGYKFCKDDGPVASYFDTLGIFYSIYRSSNNKSNMCFIWTNQHNSIGTLKMWAQNTNHILCYICNDFCKQKCF